MRAWWALGGVVRAKAATAAATTTTVELGCTISVLGYGDVVVSCTF